MSRIQSWNPRSQKWVLIDTAKKAGIIDMSSQKFEGVPVAKGKPEPQDPGDFVKEPEGESNEKDNSEDKDLDSEKDNEGGGWLW